MTNETEIGNIVAGLDEIDRDLARLEVRARDPNLVERILRTIAQVRGAADRLVLLNLEKIRLFVGDLARADARSIDRRTARESLDACLECRAIVDRYLRLMAEVETHCSRAVVRLESALAEPDARRPAGGD